MSSRPPTLATPILPTPDVTVCRQYSFPAALQDAFDGWLQQLSWSETWSQGIEIGAATPDEVASIFDVLINVGAQGGCHVVGEIIELATDTIPDWSLVCDGTTYANVDYPELASVISAGLVVDGTHFRVPDRINRIGMYGPPTGVQGGENTHVLTTAEIPSHTHDYIATNLPEASVVLGALEGIQAGPQTLQTGATGGGGGHNNLQQYEGTVFVIVARSS